MPLVLSMRERQDFFIGDERFVIDHVYSETHFRVRNVKSGKVFDITDTMSTEVMTGVTLFAGDREQAMLCRVAIDAPRDVIVLRGERYRAYEKEKRDAGSTPNTDAGARGQGEPLRPDSADAQPDGQKVGDH